MQLLVAAVVAAGNVVAGASLVEHDVDWEEYDRLSHQEKFD